MLCSRLRVLMSVPVPSTYLYVQIILGLVKVAEWRSLLTL